MRRSLLPLSSALLLSASAALLAAPQAGCAPSDGEDVGSSEQANTAEDLALAKEMVNLLGGDEGRCSNCHGVTLEKVKAWGTSMQAVDTACFAPAGLTARERIDCLRSQPTTSTSPFSARRLGLYAAGVRGDQFKELFEQGFSADTWSAEYVAFAQKAGMPRGGAPLSAAEFAKLKGWVLRGMPQLDQAFGVASDAGAPDSGAPDCTPSTTPEFQAHLAEMKTNGWGARLLAQATPMFGCGSETDPLLCMTNLPDATQTFGAPNVNQKMRQLYKQPLSSHYWVRSSADGRYVGFGMNTSAKVIDLDKPSAAIKIAADYDPFFLPSNDGFAFAGSHNGNAITLCRQSLLADVESLASPSINLEESKCTKVGNNVYMSIGTALEGDRYFMTWGAHENDDGGHQITHQLPASFSATATTIFTPMVNDGLSYKAQPRISVQLPREGDMMLSPSSRLAATRFAANGKARGFRLRFVKPTQTAAGADGGASSLSIDLPKAGEICVPGAKAGFSFDERFVVTHQYVDNAEPDQTNLPDKSANIVIVDLATGQQLRLTNSKAGEYALYPHFRADGWLYFLVRDMNDDVEYVVATDIALRMANP